MDVGGGFGVRNEIYPEFVAVMLAAQGVGPAGEMARHPLGDAFRAIITAAAAELTGELALDERGRFLALARRMAA